MQLALQPAQQWMKDMVTLEQAQALGRSYKVVTGMDGDRVLGVAGIELYWEGRGMLWSFLADNVARQFVAMHRIAKKFVQDSGVRRLEAHVEVGFGQGHRWMKALGFYVETPCARAYQAGGRDCTIYARVSE